MLGDVFHILRFDFYAVLLLIVFSALIFTNKLPPVESIRKLVATLDDRGGNILLLAFFSAWFFATSVKLFYFAIQLISAGKIDAKDAVLMMALTWITGSAFGGSFGAMLKTLTGTMTVTPPHSSVDGSSQNISVSQAAKEASDQPKTGT